MQFFSKIALSTLENDRWPTQSFDRQGCLNSSHKHALQMADKFQNALRPHQSVSFPSARLRDVELNYQTYHESKVSQEYPCAQDNMDLPRPIWDFPSDRH